MGMGVLSWSPSPPVTMYRVAANMTETYYGDETRKSNLEAPRVTVNNHRMTNIQLQGGTVVQGIRRNNDLGHENLPPQPYEAENPMKPLRYTQHCREATSGGRNSSSILTHTRDPSLTQTCRSSVRTPSPTPWRIPG